MPFNKAYLLISLLVFGFTCQSQTIIPGGYVSGTWDEAGSPYHIMESIIIHEDSSLLITKNVELLMHDSVAVVVNGHIAAIGEIGEYIYWNAEEMVWDGIYINENQSVTDSCVFRSCIFNPPVSPDKAKGGIFNINKRSRILLEDCWFNNINVKHKGAALYLNDADIMVIGSYFQSNEAWSDSSSHGGAIYMEASSPVLFGNYFTDNSSRIAGAIYGSNSSPIIRECIFRNQYTRGGGGGVLVLHDTGYVEIENCEFSNNYATGSGGAIAFLEGITGLVKDCLFQDNLAASPQFIDVGGAVFITAYDNNITFENCSFKQNTAQLDGGAIYSASDINVTGCLFYGNMNSPNPYSGGGAIAVAQANLNVLNSTFSWNMGELGNTIFGLDANIALINSIIWGGEPLGNYNIYLTEYQTGTNLYVGHTLLEGGASSVGGEGLYTVDWASGNIDSNPMFLLPDSIFSLAWNSPCINAGRSDTLQFFIPAEDLAGNPRIMGGEIDMGCYEYQGPISIPEKVKNEDFVVYPNPAKDHIYIRSGREFDGRLTISDLSGRKVVVREVNISQDSPIRQALPGIPAGFYILNLNSKDYSLSQKLIIK